MGHLHLRKVIKNETTWKDKNKSKHKCCFTENCILKVIDSNEIVKYYNVMKCNKCLSFISVKEPNNVQGRIFRDLTVDEQKLPLLIGYCKHFYNIGFNYIEKVTYLEKQDY